MSGPEFDDLSSETVLGLADSYQVDENYEEAVDAYAAGLSLLRESEVALQIRALSHRSAAFYKLERFEEALDDAQNCLKLLSDYEPSKLRIGDGEICHRRAGMAAFKLKRYLKAKDFLLVAAQHASLNDRFTNQEFYTNLIKQCDTKLTPTHSTTTCTTAHPTLPTVKKEKKSVINEIATIAATSKPKKDTPLVFAKSCLAAPKYQYYQSGKIMTIAVLEAGVQQNDLTVEIEPKHLVVILRKNGTDFIVVSGALYSEIDIEKSKVIIKNEKILIKLRKVDTFEWHELLGKDDGNNANRTTNKQVSGKSVETTKSCQNNLTIPDDTSKVRPYMSHRDWNAIEKNIVEEEKNEKPEGDEAMNRLFKQIYGNSNDDTRRAMVKSFQTSGGTVLSTNWDEVKDKDYEKERTAPDGVEWKNWDGEKIP